MSAGTVRVLLLTHSYSPEVSPPQRRWDSFIYVMRSLDWDVSVVTPRSSDAEGQSSQKFGLLSNEVGLHGERIRGYSSMKKPQGIAGKVIKHALDGFLMLPRAILQPRPDVVVATVPSLPTMFSGFLIARLLRRPLIIEMRDAWPDLISDSRILRWKWLTLVAHQTVRLIQRKAALVVTVTDGFARVLRNDGVSVVRTVHNGISTRNFEPLVQSTRETDGKLRVLYLGNLGESQGLESVIKASALARDIVELRIVGAGTASERLRQCAKENNVSVRFEPPARGAAIRAHYQWADTCVVSLRDDWKSFDHTVPSKIYELLALGKHITGIVKGEAAEILSQAGAGDIVDHSPENIVELWTQLANHLAQTEVGTAGQEWVFEKASLEKLGEKYVELILNVAR